CAAYATPSSSRRRSHRTDGTIEGRSTQPSRLSVLAVPVTSKAIRSPGNPRLVPQHGVHDSPQVETVSPAAFHLLFEEPLEEVVVEVPLFGQRRSFECRKATSSKVALGEPLLHRGAETLLAAVDHVVIEVRLRGFLQDRFADGGLQFVRR